MRCEKIYVRKIQVLARVVERNFLAMLPRRQLGLIEVGVLRTRGGPTLRTNLKDFVKSLSAQRGKRLEAARAVEVNSAP